MEYQIKTFFQQRSIKVPDGWIPACIEFIKEDHGIQNVGNSDWLKEKVYEQWLHTDLTELGTCCLPFNLNKQKSTTIKGSFALQVNQVKDIGLPAYSQLQKLRKDDVENTTVSADKMYSAAWEPKPTRMLLLQLTDGTSVVQGMEYRPINSLSLAMKPGIKVLIKGIIESRRGMLLLTKDHITVLGGEVENLLVVNAPENIIRKTLRLETTANPIQVPNNFVIEPTQLENQSEYYNTQTTQSSLASFTNAPREVHQNSRIGQPFDEHPDPFEDDFDDFFDTETEKALIEAERNASCTMTSELNKNRSKFQRAESSISQNKGVSNPFQKESSGNRSFKEGGSQKPLFQNKGGNFFEDDDDDDDDFLLAAIDIPSEPSDFNSKSNFKSRSHFEGNSFQSFNERNKEKKDVFNNRMGNSSTNYLNPNKGNVFTSTVNPINRNVVSKFQNSEVSSEGVSKIKFGAENVNFKRNNFPSDRCEAPESPKTDIGSNKCDSKTKGFQKKLSNFVFEKKNRGDAPSVAVKPQVVSGSVKDVVDQSPPYQYICYMNLSSPQKVSYTIKGFVTTLISKLSQTNDRWNLLVKINDGTGSCNVDIDDQVLRKLIGMSVEEFRTQKVEALSNPALRNSLSEKMCRCQMELIKMCCLFAVEVDPLLARPRIVNLTPLTEVHLQQIKERSLKLPDPHLLN